MRLAHSHPQPARGAPPHLVHNALEHPQARSHLGIVHGVRVRHFALGVLFALGLLLRRRHCDRVLVLPYVRVVKLPLRHLALADGGFDRRRGDDANLGRRIEGLHSSRREVELVSLRVVLLQLRRREGLALLLGCNEARAAAVLHRLSKALIVVLLRTLLLPADEHRARTQEDVEDCVLVRARRHGLELVVRV